MANSPSLAANSSSDRQPVTVELEPPVQFGSELVERIVLQPVTGRHMRHVPLPVSSGEGRGVTPDYYLDLASRLSGYPPALFDLMGPGNVLRIVHVVNEMVDPSVATTGRA